jgi:hypothetical protein
MLLVFGRKIIIFSLHARQKRGSTGYRHFARLERCLRGFFAGTAAASLLSSSTTLRWVEIVPANSEHSDFDLRRRSQQAEIMSSRIFWSFPMPPAAGIGAGRVCVSSGADRKFAAFLIFLPLTFGVDRKSILE